MRIDERLTDSGPSFSFEFFPPKTEDGARNLATALDELSGMDPTFVSVTYGAGGSTRERTHATVKRILRETTLTPAAPRRKSRCRQIVTAG